MAKKSKTVRNTQEQQLNAENPGNRPEAEAKGFSKDKTLRDKHELIIECAQVEHQGQEAKVKLGDKILAFAQSFCDAEGEFNVAEFEKACRDEETFIKSDEAGPMKTNRIPRTWTQYKSDIVKMAKDFQGAPSDYKAISELRTDLSKLRKQRGGGTGSRTKQTVVAATDILDPTLATRIVEVIKLYEKQTDTGREMTIEALDMLIAKQKADVEASPRTETSSAGSAGLLDDLDGAEDADDLDVVDEALAGNKAGAVH